MREFFRGWKRKVGVVTLVTACLLTAAMLRTRYCVDLIYLNSRFIVISGSDAFQIVEGGFAKANAAAGDAFEMEIYLERSLRNRFSPLTWSRFTTPKAQIYLASGGTQTRLSMIPYWSIVIPLALLSTWLLLSKPLSGRNGFANRCG